MNETNKLMVNKVRDYRTSQPALSNPDVDWVEFEKDYQTRVLVEAAIYRLRSILDGLENKKILHDYDNYNMSLKDYGYSQYQLGAEKVGYQIKVDELSQFFNRTGTTNGNTTP